MSKKFPAGRCVHCLRHFEKLTSDHVFPSSWYPESTPDNIEKWQIPSCSKCNSDHGKNENDLLQRIGLCIGSEELASLGISDKVRRSIDPRFARNENEKDAMHRQKKRESLIRQLMPKHQVPNAAYFPNFGPQESSGNFGIPIPKKGIEVLAEKLVRGITFISERKFIESDYCVDLIIAKKAAAEEFIGLVKRFGQTYERGPGIRIGRAVTVDDPNAAVFDIEIWKRFRFYATVEPRGGTVI